MSDIASVRHDLALLHTPLALVGIRFLNLIVFIVVDHVLHPAPYQCHPNLQHS